jgi:uncharacterized membrane protein
VPGLLILILGILAVFGWAQYYPILFVLVLSVVLLIKGFGIDRAAKNLFNWIKEYSPPPLKVQISNFSLVAGALAVVLGAYLGWTNIAPKDLTSLLNNFGRIAGQFIEGATTLIGP